MRDNQKSIVLVASDPGSARALIPVVRELAGRGASVRAVVSGPSIAIFDAELKNVMGLHMPDGITIDSASKLLLDARAEILITGAGAYNQIEHTFRLVARIKGIRSISVLDYWFEYVARFQRLINGATVQSHPDIVCALDELSKEGLVGAGLKADQVVITGGPNLEETLRWWQEIGTKKMATFQKKYGITNPVDRIVVFFSEPYFTMPTGKPLIGPGGLFRSDGIPVFGYTAPNILKMVIDSLLKRVTNKAKRINLLIKPHPLEWPDALYPEIERVQTERIRAKLLLDANPKELIAISDVVIGMSSITLLEAALIGKPAISVQVGLQTTQSFDPCIGNKLGFTIPVFDRETLDKVMGAVWEGDVASLRPRPVHQLNIIGAAARVADVVLMA